MTLTDKVDESIIIIDGTITEEQVFDLKHLFDKEYLSGCFTVETKFTFYKIEVHHLFKGKIFNNTITFMKRNEGYADILLNQPRNIFFLKKPHFNKSFLDKVHDQFYKGEIYQLGAATIDFQRNYSANYQSHLNKNSKISETFFQEIEEITGVKRKTIDMD